MKIAIASQGKEKTSLVDFRFGRCAFFQIVDLKNPETVEVISNSGKQNQRGAGITASQLIAGEKVDKVFAGNFGPNALQALKSVGIEPIIEKKRLKVKEIIERYSNGKK